MGTRLRATIPAIGNGTNDAAMLAGAALGIAILGSEATSARALTAADVVARSLTDTLLNATLRS